MASSGYGQLAFEHFFDIYLYLGSNLCMNKFSLFLLLRFKLLLTLKKNIKNR